MYLSMIPLQDGLTPLWRDRSDGKRTTTMTTKTTTNGKAKAAAKPAPKAAAKVAEKAAPKEKKQSIKAAIFALLEKKGVDEVTADEMEKVARSINPKTAFKASHPGWYRAAFRKANGIAKPKVEKAAAKANGKAAKNGGK